MGLPLSGVRVVEWAGECGELGARLLADLGADVVSVERAHAEGDPSWAVRNTNKRLIALGRLGEFLADADIFITTHHPAPATGPHVVVTTVTPFGLSGPYRDYAASDPVLVALSGCLYRAGVPELPPVLTPARFADDVAGIVAAWASLLAYWQRLATGRGQHLDVSALEANAQTTDWGLTTAGAAGGNVAYGEVRSGAGPVYPLVRCADGWVRPSIVTPGEWAVMRAWMGDAVSLHDEVWGTAAARAAMRDEIARKYESFFADKPRIALCEEGQARRMTITPLLDVAEVLAAPHFEALGTFVEAVGTRVPAGFLELDGARAGVRAAPAACAERERWLGPAFASGRPATRRGEPPLRGLRVLDFGVAGAAPEVGRLFAEYGADVLTVESRDHPDLFRVIMGTELSAPFVSSNRSKRSVGVDARHPGARPVVDALVRSADVIVENLPYGSMQRLGLGWEDVARVNPRVVMVSSQLMGPRGPWRDWRGYGSNTQPVAGLTWLWDHPGGAAPVGANVALPDHIVGRLGAMAAMACLVARLRTGRGGHVEIAQVEVVVNLLAEVFAREGLSPGSVTPQGNRSDRGAPWGVYPCAGTQRWCAITCGSDEEWERLRAAIGAPALPQWATAAGRRADHDELDKHVAAWTSARTDRAVMETLQARGVAAAMMMYPSDMPTDPHLLARGYIRRLDQPGMGTLLVEGPAFSGTDLPDVHIGPAPRLGEHTYEVCREVGIPRSEVDELVASGALFVPSAQD
jgi:crotonobetainyl-CoA:carnitine CoA-transferase CaiB-like acyl-CoA transferase